MKKNDNLLKLTLTYSAILLIATIIGISVLIYKKEPRERVITETVVQTEHIYVWVGGDTAANDSDITQSAAEDYVRIVKEYEGKIGIFTEDGALVNIIDVYVKTLPETDRRLLREGIKVLSEQELRSITQDYSS